MDPKRAYDDIFQAMKTEDFETARELALALKNWFKSGGFCPPGYSRQAIDDYINSVLRRTTEGNEDMAFSLSCLHCDDGTGYRSEEEAMEHGWTEIQPTPLALQSNFCGLCPDCRAKAAD